MTIWNGRRLAIGTAAFMWLSIPCTMIADPNAALAASGIAPDANDLNFLAPASSHLPMDPRLVACLPGRLHPVSRMFLEAWLADAIGTPTFRRFFHMPNSDYLKVSKCLVIARKAISPPHPASGKV